MLYEVLSNLKYNGTEFKKGDDFECDESEAGKLKHCLTPKVEIEEIKDTKPKAKAKAKAKVKVEAKIVKEEEKK